MAGIDTSSGNGKRRAIDQEINMVPFIDLLMVTISFLLITAVWSSMARITATANEPSVHGEKYDATKHPAVLHVRVAAKSATEGTFVLQWQRGNDFVDFETIPMSMQNGGYPALEEAMLRAYQIGQRTQGLSGDDLGHEANVDATTNAAILHFDNAFAFKDVVKVLDAVYAPRRWTCLDAKPTCCGKPNAAGKSTEGCSEPASDVPAFAASFAAD